MQVDNAKKLLENPLHPRSCRERTNGHQSDSGDSEQNGRQNRKWLPTPGEESIGD